MSELRGRGDGDDRGGNPDDNTGELRTPNTSGDQSEAGSSDSRRDSERWNRDRTQDSPEALTPQEKLSRYLDDLYWPGYPGPPKAEQEEPSQAGADTCDDDEESAGSSSETTRGEVEPQAASDDLPPNDNSGSPSADLRLASDDTLPRLERLSPSGVHEEDASTPEEQLPPPGDTAPAAGAPMPAPSVIDKEADQAKSASPDPEDIASPASLSVDPVDSEVDPSDRDTTGPAADRRADAEASPDGENRATQDAAEEPGVEVEAEQAESSYARLVTQYDKTWDPAEAVLPPAPLPESAKSLDPDIVKTLHPDVRRVLEYQGAAEYITAHKDQRPWLEAASDASPQVQRLFTAIDQGNGHAHIRHGPMGTDQLYADRVARLEDPAQTDPAKRSRSIDGLDESKQHYCAQESTRIHDAEAFVTAFAAAVKHPDVRGVLDAEWDVDTVPRPVAIPIADLLGADGHESCSGYRLAGEWPQVKQLRKQWVQARAAGQDLAGIPEPSAERIPTFEAGKIIVAFRGNDAEQRYEISTLYPQPPTQQPT